jgi:IS30 family transposase
VGHPPSTVSRELARDRHPEAGDPGDRPYAAHRAAASRWSRPEPAKLAASTALAGYVQAGLHRRWSPEQICHALVR